MRLLVILSLIVSALAMVAPAQAAPGGMAVDCHAMPGTDSGDPHDRKAPKDDLRLGLHACPGCAFLRVLAPLSPSAGPLAIPRDVGAATKPPSFATSPIPPPPRAA